MATEPNKNQNNPTEKIKKQREIVLRYLDEQAGSKKKLPTKASAVAPINPLVGKIIAKKPIKPSSEVQLAAKKPIVAPKAEPVLQTRPLRTKKAVLPAAQESNTLKIIRDAELKAKKTQALATKSSTATRNIRIAPSIEPVDFNKLIKESSSPSAQVQLFSFLTAAIAVALGFYMIFCLAVYTFSIDNAFSRKLADRLPVPAILSSAGLINYYDYQDSRKEVVMQLSQKGAIDESEFVFTVRKTALKKRLAEIMALSRDVSLDDLPLAIVNDRTINKNSLEVAAAIEQSWRASLDYKSIEAKYGLSSEAQFLSQGEIVKLFGDPLDGMGEGQVSGVLATDHGFYIAQPYGKAAGMTGIRYFFIEAKTLSELLDEKVSEVRYFSLLR